MNRRVLWLYVACVLLIAAFGWILAPADPYQTGVAPPAAPPGTLLLGSDTLGRDLLSRVLHGGPLTIASGAGAALVAWTAGAILGAAASLGPRWLRPIARLFTESFLALPMLLTALIVIAVAGSGLFSVSVAVGIAQAGAAAQVWRGVILSILREPYVAGAAALGASRSRVAASHVLPNVLPAVASYYWVLFASSLLTASGLSFLGLTGDLASPDWGNLMAEGRRAIRYAPWIMLAPAAALLLVTSALSSAARLINQR